MVNVSQPQFDEPREQDGFVCQRARLGQQAGSQRLGLSLWRLPPGQAAYPHHYHLTEEEMLIVLKGKPSLRTEDGWQEMEEGEVVCFLAGENGVHQLVNRSEQTVDFLAVSTSGVPDIVIYPDSEKIGANERRTDGTGLRKMFRLSDAVDYWLDEEPPTGA